MSKRFLDTEFFKMPLIRSLEGAYKLLYLYISCECDHAGIWTPELDVVSLRLGREYEEEKAIKALKERITILGDGSWFLPDFVSLQYGSELNEENRVHKSVLERLSKFPELSPFVRSLRSPLQRAKDKDKDKDKDKGEGEESEGGGGGWKPSPAQIRINSLVNRRESTRWSDKESKALKKAAPTEEDLDLVEWFYRQSLPENSKIKHRVGIEAILNNWGGEIDKARQWKAGKNGGRSNIPRDSGRTKFPRL